MTDSDAQSPERDRPASPPTGWRRWSRSVRLWVVVALSTVVLTMLTSTFVMQPFLIPSGSMEGTLQVGDRVIVNKLAYRFGGEVQRGDIIVFDGTGSFVAEDSDPGLLGGLLRTAGAAVGLAQSSETDYVKRVIGIGGDRVRCCDDQGRIEVNGEPLDEPYLYPGDQPSNVMFDIRVPEGRLWVMGDHRSDSADSREYLGSPGGGTVPEDKVIGRVELIGWPVDRWGWLRSDHG
ncbi:signal peptidase I [Streptomyces litchfieldiae]|uniref:Signal peptidase I n=1 Tax=Streptomyces litchfieldiae TaxID=3075543 RepID=A0ABU2MI58_9ACTN|nr:signal peptidase I [Streptomyces sp. DSM 44938]MDT0341142.1 signal peptidase I [Streptomyces sp. DSM 44938]